MKQKVFDYIEELEKRTKQYENALKNYQELETKNVQTEYNNKKAIEYIENYLCSDEYIQSDINSIANAFVKLIGILKGVELTENDKKQVKWLKEEFKVGVDKE